MEEALKAALHEMDLSIQSLCRKQSLNQFSDSCTLRDPLGALVEDMRQTVDTWNARYGKILQENKPEQQASSAPTNSNPTPVEEGRFDHPGQVVLMDIDMAGAVAERNPNNNGHHRNPLLVVKHEARKISTTTTPHVAKSPDWLPEGWYTQVKTRMCGITAGLKYKYFCDPVSKRRFRSKREVFSFLETGKLGRYKRKPKAPLPLQGEGGGATTAANQEEEEEEEQEEEEEEEKVNKEPLGDGTGGVNLDEAVSSSGTPLMKPSPLLQICPDGTASSPSGVTPPTSISYRSYPSEALPPPPLPYFHTGYGGVGPSPSKEGSEMHLRPYNTRLGGGLHQDEPARVGDGTVGGLRSLGMVTSAHNFETQQKV